MLFRKGDGKSNRNQKRICWKNIRFMNLFYEKTPPGYIHRPGGVCLPQMGEIGRQLPGAGCQVTSPLRKAKATASDRLATPNLERILLTWVLMVDGLTTSLAAIWVLFKPFNHQSQHNPLALG
jgi:hypothetical protein